jgi:hypothetical protein
LESARDILFSLAFRNPRWNRGWGVVANKVKTSTSAKGVTLRPLEFSRSQPNWFNLKIIISQYKGKRQFSSSIAFGIQPLE